MMFGLLDVWPATPLLYGACSFNKKFFESYFASLAKIRDAWVLRGLTTPLDAMNILNSLFVQRYVLCMP